MAITFLPGSAQGYCASSYYAAATPQTTYQFRARDRRDHLQPVGVLLQVTTARLDPGAAGVALTLDGGTAGSTTVDALEVRRGRDQPARRPARMIHAVNRSEGRRPIQVTAPSGGGRRR